MAQHQVRRLGSVFSLADLPKPGHVGPSHQLPQFSSHQALDGLEPVMPGDARWSTDSSSLFPGQRARLVGATSGMRPSVVVQLPLQAEQHSARHKRMCGGMM